MRGGTPVRAGTYPYEGDDLVTGWHHHDLHQLEYAFEGVVEVETETAHYLLPPQQAVWIPAELTHCTTIKHHVKTLSVFFDPALVPSPDERARILPAAPLIKEMILYTARWPILRSVSDPMADGFFETLAHLVLEWLDRETPLCPLRVPVDSLCRTTPPGIVDGKWRQYDSLGRDSDSLHETEA